MNIDEFKKIIQSVIIPMFPGSTIVGDKISTKSESCIAFTSGKQAIYMKPEKSSLYRIKIKRNQVFENDDKNFIDSFITELRQYNKIPIGYRDELIKVAVERSISNHLSSSTGINKDCISNILNQLSTWSGRTYEGREVSYGIEICNKKKVPSQIKWVEKEYNFKRS